MNTEVRRKLEMAARVREFTGARVATVPGYVPVLTKFEGLLTRAEGIAARQLEGRVAAREARAQREELRRVLHTQLVHYLVAVGSVAARGIRPSWPSGSGSRPPMPPTPCSRPR
jgi:hypothetical protein